MFSAIEKLSRGGTLLVTVCKEDDHALRVGVTQIATGSKAEPPLRQLSFVGTAAELDASFAEAISIWLTPLKSLTEQARAAVNDEEDDADASSGKPKAGGSKRATEAQAVKQKPVAGASGEAAPAPGAAPTEGAEDVFILELF